jgi:nicotinamidase-related amidase
MMEKIAEDVGVEIVDTTARSAFMRGFGVLVLEDTVATFEQERDLHDASLRNLSLLFAVIGDASVLARAPA